MSFFNQDHKQGNGASGPDFAALVERAKSQPGAMEPMNALWGAVYQLPYWRFVARGAFPSAYPCVCFIDGQHWVMAFTDESALRAFVATQSGQVESDASQMLLEIERVGGMLSWLQTKGVHHIMFNYGLHAFHAPLVNIPAMYEHFNGRKLPGAKVQALTMLDLILKPELIKQSWDYFRDVQTKETKYTPFITAQDQPATWLNTRIMSEYRERLRKFYYDPRKHDTYLEQLGITYPTVRAAK